MAIHVRELEELRRLARDAQASRRFGPATGEACPRCAELAVGVRALITEVERLRSPYAQAFRDGAEGALDFAARALSAMGERSGARVLRDLRTAIEGERHGPASE